MFQDHYLLIALIVLLFLSLVVLGFFFIRNRNLEKRYNLFMQALDRAAIIVTTDTKGYIISANDQFCESSGYQRSELIGKHSRILKSGLHPDEVYKKMWETITAGKIWLGEVCNRRKDGTYFWVDGPIMPLFNENGQIYRYVAFRQNVTGRKEFESQLVVSRKQLQENLDWRRNILDSANYIIIATDKEGTILTFNKYAENALGYQSNEVVGRTSPIIFHKIEELIIQSRENLEKEAIEIDSSLSMEIGFDMLIKPAIHSVQPIDKEMTYIKKDGVNFPVRLSISCLKDNLNTITGYLMIASDITQERAIKNQLIQAKELAMQASKVKSDFLANMSHEVRTPLNGIIGMTDLLLESDLNADQKKCSETVLASAHNLLTIINDILDFSKIESGKMELEKIPFNLKAMIDEHLQSFKYSAEKKELYFKATITELPFEVYGDSARLGQILNNLVGNAIKFTLHGGVIFECELEEDKLESVRMKFTIRDTGVGIPDEAKGRMFQSFSQADRSMARKFGGSGLGLSIVKRLVDLMGGKVQFESGEESGTIFWFTLEFAKGEMITKTEEKVALKQTELLPIAGRVLVAEDVVTNQQLFARILKKFGCRYHIVSNGKEAIDALDNGDYDAVLMDCQMPEMDGYEATRLIRNKHSKIPIIALTANALSGDREKCIECGMNDYLSKPVTQVKLHETLSRYIKPKAGA